MHRHLWMGLAIMIACGEQVVVRDQVALCGNGKIDAGEQCDDGNRDPGDACTDGCQAAFCGDGIQRTDLELGMDGADINTLYELYANRIEPEDVVNIWGIYDEEEQEDN